MSGWRGLRFAAGLLVVGSSLGCQGDTGGDSGPTRGDSDSGALGDSAVTSGTHLASHERPLSFLQLGAVQVCEHPAESITYTEQGEALGLLGPTASPGEGGSGSALAVEDLDRDGDLDIVLGFVDERMSIFWWDGAQFNRGTMVTDSMTTNNINLADLDGDGWVEILTGGKGFPGIVWNERGDLTDHEVLTLDGELARTRELSAGDIDGDGDVDLYALTVKTGSMTESLWDMILWNDGDRSFTLDVDALDQETATGQGFDAAWFDWDDDGDLDIYVSNDQGTLHGPDFMLRNDDGQLFDARDDCICGPTHTGMNVDAADYDGDGLFDVIITTAANNVLLKQYADRTFVDVTQVANAYSHSDLTDDPTGWGAVFFDQDNDGDQDMLVALGGYTDGRDGGENETENEGPMPLSLLRNTDGVFAEIGPELGLEQSGTFRSLVAQDFNSDGVLDFIATDIYAPPKLYLSDSCTANHWLRIEGPPGAKVTVTAGDRTWVDHITRESGYAAGQPANVHVGLGAADHIDRLELRLLDGRTLVHEGLVPDRIVSVVDPFSAL